MSERVCPGCTATGYGPHGELCPTCRGRRFVPVAALAESPVQRIEVDPGLEWFEHCPCCDYLTSILTDLHKDGPEKLGAERYNLVCSLLDDLGK